MEARRLAGPLLGLAAVVLLAVAGALSSGPAQAQSVSSPAIWEATLTAGPIEGFGGWGYNHTSASGSLNSAEFVLEGTTYRINQLRRGTNTRVDFASDPTDVQLTLDSALPAGDFQFRIGIPAVVLNLSDATIFRGNYRWSNVSLPGLPWVAGQPVPVQLRRAQGVTISNAALAVGEGFTRTYTVVLDSQPTGDVTVTPVSGSPDAATVSPPSLTFNESNWNTPQTVTVHGVSRTAGGGTATITHAVAGADYGSVTAGDVAIRVSVGKIFWSGTMVVETAGRVRPSVGYVQENNAGSLTPNDFIFNGTSYAVYDISYYTDTNSGLIVQLSSALDAGRFVLRLDDAAITFDGAVCTLEEGASQCHYDLTNPGLSWSDGQTVQVSLALGEPEISIAAVDDMVTEGSPAAFTVTAGRTLSSALTVNLNITADGGANGDYGVVSGDQTATIEAGDTSVTHSVPTAGDDVFETDGSVTATLADGDGYTIATTQSDRAATVTVEDDEPSRTLSHSAPAPTVTEGASGTTVVMSFTVTASGASAYPVGCWTHSSGTATENVDYDHRNLISGGNTFSAADPTQLSWAFDVTVNGDDIDEEDETIPARCGFDGIPGNVQNSGTITDDDERGVTFEPRAFAVGRGGTADYTVVLNSEPTGDVTVTPASDTSVATVSGALTFTPGNWNTPQTVTVTGVSNGNRSISHTITSDDPKYDPYGSALTIAVSVSDPIDYDRDNDNLIEIANLRQLNAMRWDLDGNGAVAAGDQVNYNDAFSYAPAGMGCEATCAGYELTEDLDFDTNTDGMTSVEGDNYWNGGAGWAPIGGDYNAEFHGNGHTISNLFINRGSASANVGLFSVLGNAAYIHHVGLINVNVTGNLQTGALAGGDADNATGSRISAVYVNGGSVAGVLNVGGLTGGFEGTQTAVWTAVNVSSTDPGGDSLPHTGGITAFLVGSVNASYAIGSVTSNVASSRGGVKGTDAGTANAAWFNSETVVNTVRDAAQGKVTAELQTPTGYAGIYSAWDVDLDGDGTDDNPWDFGSASQYPILKADRNGDGTFTWQEFGDQGRGVPPDAPNAPTASFKTVRSLLLTWDAQTGADNYDVRYQLSTAGQFNWTDGPQDVTETGAVVDGLTPGQTYEFQVRATNAVGDSAWSPSSAAVMMDSDIKGGIFWWSTMTVRRAAEGGSALGYEEGVGSLPNSTFAYGGGSVRITRIDVLGIDEQNPAENRFEVRTSLLDGAARTPNSGYMLHTDGGVFTWDTFPITKTFTGHTKLIDWRENINTYRADLRLVETLPPLAPAVTVTPRMTGEAGQLDIAWTPADNTGRPAVTVYKVRYRLSSVTEWTEGMHHLPASHEPSIFLASLETGAAYDVQMRAVNIDGDGPWSATATGNASNGFEDVAIWSATMTAGVQPVGGGGPRPFTRYGYVQSGFHGGLSSNAFSYNGQNYTVNDLYHSSANSFVPAHPTFNLSRALGGKLALVFRADGETHVLRFNGVNIASAGGYDLTSSRSDWPALPQWAAGTQVIVALLPAPELSVAAVQDSITEGESAEFAVTASRAPIVDLPVTLNIAATGDYGVDTGNKDLVIMAGRTTSAIYNATTTGDNVDAEDGTVTATLAGSVNYNIGVGSATVGVTNDDDAPPTVSIAADQARLVFSGDTVQLRGMASDRQTADADLTIAWTQTGGTPSVMLTGANTATASFTAPNVTANTDLTFRLTVTDGGANTATADVTITIGQGFEGAIWRSWLTAGSRNLTYAIGGTATRVGFEDSGGLTDRGFSHAGTYFVAEMFYDRNRRSHSGESLDDSPLYFYLSRRSTGNSCPGANLSGDLVLAIRSGGQTTLLRFDGADAQCIGRPAGLLSYALPNHGLSWSAGDLVEVALLPPTTLSIEAVEDTVLEESPVRFRVTADRAPLTDLPVTVNIAVVGNYGITAGNRDLVIPAGQTSVNHNVDTRDDNVRGSIGSVTATLVDTANYNVAAAPANVAQALIHDTQNTLLWDATLNSQGVFAGVNDTTGYFIFGSLNSRRGSLTPNTFSFRGAAYSVSWLASSGGNVTFTVDRGLGLGTFVLTMGGNTRTFQGSDSWTYRVPGTFQADTSIRVTLWQSQGPPVFTDGDAATRSIDENAGTALSPGAPIGGPVTANDPNPGQTVTYSLSGTNAASFTFNANNGQISTKAGVTYDYEAKASYLVTMSVTDSTVSGDNSASIDVTIELNDVIEPPLAPGQPSLVAQSETILRATVTPPPDNTGRPAITGYGAQYRVNGSVGPFTLSDADSLTPAFDISNLQANTEYEVQVRAVNDEGNGAWSASGTGSTDAPAGPPTFSVDSPSVNEGSDLTFTATLSSPATAVSIVRYSLGGSAAKADPGRGIAGDYAYSTATPPQSNATRFYFATGASQATITFTTVGDIFEEADETLVLTLSSPRNVTLAANTATGTIIDNDGPLVNNAPVFAQDSTSRSIAETVGAAQDTGRDIGAAVTATDADPDVLTYSLEGTDAAAFEIVAASGQLSTKAGETYDREAKASYSVTVKATDTFSANDTIDVTIGITNVSEPPLAPGTPTVVGVTTTQITVRAAAPVNTGRPAITGYEGQYRVSGSSDAFTDAGVNSSAPTIAYMGLNPDMEYEVQVRAVNADGNGAWSASGTISTSAPAPMASGSIDAVSVAVGATQDVDVSAYFTGTVDTYMASSSDDTKATVAVSGSTVTVTGVAEGAATITVTATNSGGSATQTFTVTAVAATPVITVTAVNTSVAEGQPVVFTLTATPPPGASLMVNFHIAFTGNYVTGVSAGPKDRVIGVGGAYTLTLLTTDDGVIEPDGSVTVTLATGTGYTLGNPATASVTVTDNGLPPAQPPVASGTIPVASVAVGAMRDVDVSGAFTGTVDSYTADSSDDTKATITVTATGGGATATQTFTVTVTAPPHPTLRAAEPLRRLGGQRQVVPGMGRADGRAQLPRAVASGGRGLRHGEPRGAGHRSQPRHTPPDARHGVHAARRRRRPEHRRRVVGRGNDVHDHGHHRGRDQRG